MTDIVSADRYRSDQFTEKDWQTLRLAIDVKACTPFLGAGACYGTLPTGKAIAQEWAEDIDYPFPDRDNLPRVAQYMAVDSHANEPRNRLVKTIGGVPPPDFNRPNEIHALVASMGLKVYITTNYDDFMMQALRRAGRQPYAEICQWWQNGRKPPRKKNIVPSTETPLVFHIHGALTDPETMVITEDD